jgi:hypothetical protein
MRQRTMLEMIRDLKADMDKQERLIREAEVLQRRNSETLDQIAILVGILPVRGTDPLETDTQQSGG